MLSQARHVVPPEPCQFASHQLVDVEQKSPELVSWGDDINMNTTTDPSSSSAQGYINSAPAVSVKSSGVIRRKTAVDSQKDKFSLQNHKPNIVHLASGASSALDPNCNEPGLLCLCCNGYSPQDNNSTYNLNYINNNTVTFQQQAEITQSSSDESYQEVSHQDQQSSELAQFPHSDPSGEEVDKTEDEEDARSRKEVLREEYADEDDTLIPSCWDCPPSLLEFSLSSFTSSSSTSISGCSDLESDCPDAISLSCQDFPPESQSARSLDDQLDDSILESCPPPQSTMHGRSHSGLWTPSSDSAEGERPQVEDDGLLDLQRLSESVEELGRAIHRQAAQLAQWDLEGYLELRGELDQLEVLGQENIPRGPEQVNAVFCGADLRDLRRPLDRETLSRPLDCSEDGPESSESSVYDDCVFPDACVSSRLLPSQQSAMLPRRDMDPPSFTYMNMNASTPSPPTTSSTNSSSLTFSNSALSSFSSPPREVKAPTSSLSIPPPQPIPYFSFHSSSPCGPPPIPPPRRKRQARLEALRRAGEQNGETPSSQRPPLPPPPPLPPAPPPPPQHTAYRRPAPMPTPPPPSFHALDDEIRKLLILAGVTQDELLKLGPEFGVGVVDLLEPEAGEKSNSTRAAETERNEEREGLSSFMGERQRRGGAGRPMDMCRGREERWGDGKANRLNQEMMMDRTVEGQMGKSSNEAVRMTSFTEMGRRQEGNRCSSHPSSSRDGETNGNAGTDSYYTITTKKAHNPNTSIHLNNNDRNPLSTAAPNSRPLPPPPPPLPQPPALPRANLRSFPANKCRPERLDWLIEFSPDTDTLSKPSTQGREEETSSQKFTSEAKVTTFKELRRQSKLNPTPALIYNEPEPTAITPDPDFLYSQKWTSESIEGDDRLWIYSAQAQTILQPPPVTPLAPLKEMLPLGRGEPVSHPFPLIGCSVCEHRLQTAAEERDEARAAVRGRADGGMTEDASTTDCRLSFAESVQRGGALTADGVRTQLGSHGLFSKCLQEKRALLSPISLAVDAILAQFNSSRTQVQKVQSGDSRVNPSLGRLVLQSLCPALSRLLSDGLKPYQTDLITGRRPNSAWGLVQACIGPGPSTQAMYRLQCEISQLPQLKQSRHRFNAFLLGLLNIKLLDHWVFHLQSCDDVLETHYQPTSFMWLSRTSCQPLFEELLLLLQPLSLLTFNLDLLFQHHHFDPASPIPSPANYAQEDCSPAYQACSLGIRGLSCWRRGQSSKQATGTLEDKQSRKPAALAGNSSNMELNGTANHHQGPGIVSANKGEVSDRVLWMEREVAPSSVDSLSQQARQVTQPGWGSLAQWGRKLGQSWGSYYKTKLGVPSLEYDYITHKAQQNTVPECTSPTPWVLGMLFGASRGQKGPQGCTTSARRPSQWLAPGAPFLSQIVAPAQNPEPGERAEQSEWEKARDRVAEREHPRLVRPLRMQRDHRPRGQLY